METAMPGMAVLVSCAARLAFAQRVSHPDAPIRIGHYHLNVTSVEAHKFGGRAMTFGGIDVIKFPDAFWGQDEISAAISGHPA